MAKRIEPFVGPRPFEREDEKYFFGRTQVASELVSLILAHSTVVLYAQSGAGKTSLLKAKVLSALEEQHGFEVLPIARVRGRDAATAEAACAANIYVANALRDLSGNSLAPEECGRLTFAEYLAARPRTPRPDEVLDEEDDEEARARSAASRPRVLIFDQFEELFTLYPEHYDARRKFFEQLHDALERDSLLRVVFSMREDYIAELDPYVHLMPDSMRIRFRMERLRKRAALEAVVGPLKSYNREHGKDGAGLGLRFETGVAEKLVDDLRTVKLHSGAKEIEFKGEFIEPVHLQIVCKALIEKMLAEGHEVITHRDLESFGSVNQALTEYFERAIAKAARAANIDEGDLRRWFDQVLITPENTRSTVLRGGTETAGIPNAVIDVLAGERLIRSETRDNREWYELSHDKLIGPIRESYQHWVLNQPADEQARMRYIERATKWLASRRKDDSLLLGLAELKEAWRWANPEAQGYNEALAALVEASQAALDRIKHEQALALERQQLAEAEAAAQREKAAHAEAMMATQSRAARRLRFFAAVLALMMLLSIAATAYALRQTALAERERAATELALSEATRQRNIAQQKTDEAYASSLKAEEQARIAQTKSDEAEEQRTRAVEQSRLAQEQQRRAEQQAAAAREAERHAASAAHAEKLQSEKAVLASKEAELQKTLALSSRGAARAELMLAQQPNQILASVKYALGSLALNRDSIEGEQALRHGLGLLPRLVRKIDFKPFRLSVTTSGEVTAINPDAMALFDKDGQTTYELKSSARPGLKSFLISNDGRYMAEIYDNEARIINLTDPNEKIAPIIYEKEKPAGGQGDQSNSLSNAALSPDGRYLAGIMLPSRLRAWETKTGRPVMDVELSEEHKYALRSSRLEFIFSQDGNFLEVSAAPVVSIYRIQDSARLFMHSLSGGKHVLSPKARYFAQARTEEGQGMVVRLLEVSTGKEMARWGLPDHVDQLAFSPDESKLAILSGTTVTIWDIQSGQVISRVGHTADVNRIIFSPSGNLLVTTGSDLTARLWNVHDGRELFRMGHDDYVRPVSFSPDEKYLVTGTDDIRLWDISRVGQGYDLSQEKTVYQVLPSHNGQYLAVFYGATIFSLEVKLLETLTGREVARLPPVSSYNGAFSPDDKLFFTIGSQKVEAWEVNGGKHSYEYKLDTPVLNAAFSEDGHYATLLLHDSVSLLDLLDNKGVREIASPKIDNSARITISADGKRVAFVPDAGMAQFFLWDTETSQVTRLPIKPTSVIGSTLSPDGQYLVYYSDRVHVYDISQSSYIFDDKLGKRGPGSFAFSPDGRYIAVTGLKDNKIDIFSLSDQQLVTEISSINNGSKMTFSRDGKYFASAGGGLVQVWSVYLGQELTRIGYGGTLQTLALTPDDKYVMTGSNDRSVRVALLQVEDLIDIACERTGGLTAEEWPEYFGDEKYHQVCPVRSELPGGPSPP